MAKTRYNDEELSEFKELIMKKLDSTNQELSYLQDQIKNLSEINEDSKYTGLDDGSGTSEKEHLNKMASRLLQYKKHLSNALIRIENKTYGVCRVTNKLIAKERLKAVPHATLSIEAKNQLQR